MLATPPTRPSQSVGGTDWKGDFQFLVEVRIYGKLLDAGDAMPLQAASQLQGPAPHQPFVFEDNFWDRWS